MRCRVDRSWATVAAAGLLLLAAVFGLGYQIGDRQPPECTRSEDSCRPEYVNGRWEIVTVIP